MATPHLDLLLWPYDLSLCRDDFVYGWTRPLHCAAGVIKAESIAEAQTVLQSVQTEQERNNLGHICQADLVVFGRVHSDVQSSEGQRQIAVRLLEGPESTLALILYRRPNLRRMEIYALDFHIYASSASPSPQDVNVSDFTAPSATSFSLGPVVLAQLNYGTHFDQRLQDIVRGRQPHASAQALLSVVLPYVPSQSLLHFVIWGLSLAGSRATRAAAQSMLSALSACCHQLNLRLQQSITLPRHIPRLYQSTVPSTSGYISFYVNFWNTVWLILNDITIGVALGTFVCENAAPLVDLLSSPLKTLLIAFPQDALLWLNNWPAGLKLNTELSQFYCHSLLGIILAWNRVLETLLFPSLPQLLYVAGALGTCGMTMTVSMFSDLLSCFTFHLFVCYRTSAFIYSYQLSIAASLWNLFRGKRYNILRSRKDAWDYDVDQLLLGTMLFTLVAFLSPTIFTYYAFFATARFLVVVVHAVVDTILVLMNHFPLFALLLRAKSPLRMPGGVVYKLSKNPSPSTIEIQPIAFARIFDHYVSLGSRMWSHYHPLRLLRMILRGDPLTTIPRTLIRLQTMADPGSQVD